MLVTICLTLGVMAALYALGAWLLLRRANTLDDDGLLARARVLTAEQETRWPDRDGEAKRHQVYARLRKEYPHVAKRALSRVIEDAL